MRLLEVLRAEHVVIPLGADTLRGSVVELVDQLTRSGMVTRPEKLAPLIAEERIRDVVHVGGRVLLPHFRTDAVDRLAVALGVAPKPLKVRGEQEPGNEQVVLLVLAPPDASSHYLQVVAALARALRNTETVDRLIAATTPEDVFDIPGIQELAVQPQLLVRDVMTHQAFRAMPSMPVRELIDMMIRHQLKAVPVVGEKREVLGIVSDRDILRHLLPVIGRLGAGNAPSKVESDALYATSVRDIMSRSVMCISEDQPLSEVVSTMISKDVERMPVVHSGRLTGFLTRADVVRRLFPT